MDDLNDQSIKELQLLNPTRDNHNRTKNGEVDVGLRGPKEALYAFVERGDLLLDYNKQRSQNDVPGL